MSSNVFAPPKDPDEIKPYHIVWCDKDGTNTGSATDDGELQGATISTSTWTVPTGLTNQSDNKSAATIHGVSYSANTVATIWLSGGTDGTDYNVTNRVVLSDGRTLDKTITIPVRSK